MQVIYIRHLHTCLVCSILYTGLVYKMFLFLNIVTNSIILLGYIFELYIQNRWMELLNFFYWLHFTFRNYNTSELKINLLSI